MSSWIALGREKGGVLGYLVQGGKVTGPERAAADADVLAALKATGSRILRIGEGAASRLPSKIIPEERCHLAALEQESPPDVISAWVRLWVAGLRAERADWDGVICTLHGDVTHWLHVSADEIVSAQSSLTPRLASALNIADAAPDPDAVEESLSRPEGLAVRLRAAEVTGKPGRALGALIGAELAAMRPYWLGQQVMVIAEDGLGQGYLAALRAQGVPCELSAPGRWVVSGLLALGEAG